MALDKFSRTEIKLALPALLTGVNIADVLDEVAAEVAKFCADWGEHRGSEVEFIDDHTISNPFKPYPSKLVNGRRVSAGRARKDEELHFIENVLLIYERATGQRIGRSYDEHKGREQEHPFLLACLHAARILRGPKYHPGYPRFIVRKAIKKVYPERKPGRPKTGS